MKVRFPLPCINGESSPDGFCGRFRRIVSGSLVPPSPPSAAMPLEFAPAAFRRRPPLRGSCACIQSEIFYSRPCRRRAAVSRFPSLLLFQSDFSQPIKGPACHHALQCAQSTQVCTYGAGSKVKMLFLSTQNEKWQTMPLFSVSDSTFPLCKH